MPNSITGLWGNHGRLQNTLPGVFLLRNGVISCRVRLSHPCARGVAGPTCTLQLPLWLNRGAPGLGRPGVRVIGILFMGPGPLGVGLPGSTTVEVCPPPVTQGRLAFMEALWFYLSSSKERWPWVCAVCTHWVSKCCRLHTVNQFLCPALFGTCSHYINY